MHSIYDCINTRIHRQLIKNKKSMKKFLNIFSILFVVGWSYAQTNSENYIWSTTCLDANCVKKSETVQYFDGLGRPKQIVDIKASSNQKDIVTHIVYDQYGRPSKSYLPIPQSGTQNGNIYDNPLDNAAAIYGTEKIYSEQIIENSPLERIKQSFGAGSAWANKPITYNYNVNAANEVKKYSVSTTWKENRTESPLSISGYYPVKTLLKNSVTDEDGNTAIEYKNGKGQTLLIRKNDGSKNLDTYYVYDEFNQLAYVIPPLASVLGTLSLTNIDNLCYQYRYDGLGRLVEKRVPGKGWEFMVYNKADQLIMSRDANLEQKGQWLLTKYDRYGRVVYTGISNYASGRSALQTIIDANNVLYETRSTTFFTLNGMPVYYSNTASPTSIAQILSVNYYDTYPPLPTDVVVPTFVLVPEQTVLSDSQNATVNTKSLPLASYVKNIEDDNWTKNYIWYDAKGRVIGTHSINHLGGFTKTEAELDFIGVVKRNNISHQRKSGENGVRIQERFVYDPQYRLKQHFHQVNDRAEELLAENSYNELSQLINKKVGNNLQSIDYNYNIRGWLTDINKNQMSVANLGGKLFAYKIKYNQKEGITNPDTVLFSGKNVTAKYNGNITEVDWRSVETIGVNPSLTPKRYGYSYDGVNRLTAGYYQNPVNPNSKENTESIDYDLNGNISKLYRSSIIENGNIATVIDRLRYDYAGGDNKLTSINDDSLNSTGYEGGGATIGYDLNGNMINMGDKGISTINYNYLNLSNKLNYSKLATKNRTENVTIISKYGADGSKLQKKNTTVVSGLEGAVTTIKTTDYLDGFQYLKTETIGLIEAGSLANLETSRALEMEAYSIVNPVDLPSFEALTPDLQFFPTSEGFYDYIKGQYVYQYTDHLGNVRISFARNTTGALEITDSNDYYPFGMNHLKTGSSFFGSGTYKNYKFGTKELQEIGFYDFGARQYLSDVGRWFSVDPMAASNPDITPYRYGFNNPIMFTDPTGMIEAHLIENAFNLGGNWTNKGNGFENDSYIKLGYNGDYISLNTTLDAPTLDEGVAGEELLEGVTFTGKGNSKTWNKGYNLNYNYFLMRSKISGALQVMGHNNSESFLQYQIETTKVGQSVSAAEKFLFLELPGSIVGGELVSAAWRAAGLSRYICGPLARLTNGLIKICFTEGTLVAVENGTKKIEDINEGDRVWSYNEETGKKDRKSVV